LRRLQINRQKLEVDVRLARNQMLPNLNAGAMVMNDFGKQIYKDLVDPQVKAGLEFKIPLQRREARGRLDELEGQLGQLTNDQRFAQDRIRNEIWDAFSAYRAAFDQTRQTQLNVTLAQELLSAEASRFDLGISDLLALQIREQAAFDARTLDRMRHEGEQGGTEQGARGETDHVRHHALANLRAEQQHHTGEQGAGDTGQGGEADDGNQFDHRSDIL
jgi:hypothetical protein